MIGEPPVRPRVLPGSEKFQVLVLLLFADRRRGGGLCAQLQRRDMCTKERV